MNLCNLTGNLHPGQEEEHALPSSPSHLTPRGTAVLILPCLFNGSQVASEEETAWWSLARFFPQPHRCRPSLAACWVQASPSVPVDLGRVGLGEEERAAPEERRLEVRKGRQGGLTSPQSWSPPCPRREKVRRQAPHWSRLLVVLDGIRLFTEGFFCFFFGVFVGSLSL